MLKIFINIDMNKNFNFFYLLIYKFKQPTERYDTLVDMKDWYLNVDIENPRSNDETETYYLILTKEKSENIIWNIEPTEKKNYIIYTIINGLI
jgi:hypothetical protein